MNEIKQVPRSACRLQVGEVSLGDNGEGAKSAPIKLKARSGDAITHWFWGKVIHDLAGMHTHKPRLTIDYAHNDNEVLGYLNHFDVSGGDLVASGALTPWRDDDRASEVMFKMRQGVPYEASIFFGGEGIKLEEVAEGVSAMVNGRQFDGPGVIVREWPLRGVAICPYGADQNTEARELATGDKITVETIKHEPKQEEAKMSEPVKAVEAEVKAEGVAVPVEAVAVEAEAKKVVEQKATEAAVAAPVEAPKAVAVDPVAEMKAQADRLSAEMEARTKAELAVKELTESNAKLAGCVDALKSERDAMAKRLAAIEAGAAPVSSNPAGEKTELTPWQKVMAKAKSK